MIDQLRTIGDVIYLWLRLEMIAPLVALVVVLTMVRARHAVMVGGRDRIGAILQQTRCFCALYAVYAVALAWWWVAGSPIEALGWFGWGVLGWTAALHGMIAMWWLGRTERSARWTAVVLWFASAPPVAIMVAGLAWSWWDGFAVPVGLR